MPNSAKKIVCLQFSEIEDIREITLPESRNYTVIIIFMTTRPLKDMLWVTPRRLKWISTAYEFMENIEKYPKMIVKYHHYHFVPVHDSP